MHIATIRMTLLISGIQVLIIFRKFYSNVFATVSKVLINHQYREKDKYAYVRMYCV